MFRPHRVVSVLLGLVVLLVVLVGLRPSAAAPALSIARISVASTGQQANDDSSGAAISADGRYVAFFSNASNLTSDDTNNVSDVFVHDRHTGQTRRISPFPAGTLASAGPAISADGRTIVFWTSSVGSPPANLWNIYVYDQSTGTTTLLPVRGVGNVNPVRGAYWPNISADGRYVSFESNAWNLVPGDTNDAVDVFVFDRQTEQTERVSVSSAGVQGDDQSTISDISGDGRYVVFSTDTDNLVPNDTNRGNDILVHDRQTGETRRVSLGTGGQQDPFGDAYFPFISLSGRYILFESSFGQFVPGDINGHDDIFVHDQQTGQIVRVTSGVSVESDGEGVWGRMSADERLVSFTSYATNLVAGDDNELYDIFVRTFPNGPIERVSLGVGGVEANGHSTNSAISADGRYIAFQSEASNLVPGDTNGVADVFIVDRGTGSLPATVSGLIRTSDEQPIAGATVRDWRGYSAQTDASGRFALAALPAGVYTLTVVKVGYAFTPASVTVVVPGTAELAFTGERVGPEVYMSYIPGIVRP